MSRLFLVRLVLYLGTGLAAVWVSHVDKGWTPEVSFWLGAFVFSGVWMVLSIGDQR